MDSMVGHSFVPRPHPQSKGSDLVYTVSRYHVSYVALFPMANFNFQ